MLALDEVNLLVKIEAGKRGSELEAELNARGYTLNHSPQSLHRSSIGGWIATGATGQFSSRWGGIEELVVALTVVLSSGEIIETKLAPRAAIGPDLKHLFIGSEGTLGVITEATLKIFPLAERRIFEAVVFNNIEAGLTAIRKIIRAGLRPFLVRFYDEDESRHVMRAGFLAGCVVFVGFEGLPAIAQAEYDAGIAICQAEGGQAIGANPVLAWMERRFDFSSVENILDRPGGFAETIETAHLPTYHALKEALLPLATEVLGHFSHVYPQGTSLYMILLGEAANAAAAEQRLQQIWERSMRICLEQGAVISHHHGVGLARLPYIRQDLATGVIVLDRIKEALDPVSIMNPGKLGLSPTIER
jgi:alkyldihydroxyacetonephosphate synthase